MRKVVVTSLLCLLLAGCAGDGEFRTGIGTAGLVGPPGPQGATGAAGGTGATGTVGPNGKVGQQGLQGPAGPPGRTGEPGGDGANGPGGLPGTPAIPGIPGVPDLPDVPGQLVDSNGALKGGLGITGNGGVLTNVIGSDPLSAPINQTLGDGNTVDHFVGGPPEATQAGLIPATAGALAGTNSVPLLGSGAGVTGSGGLSQDLLGADAISPLLGTNGVIPDNISGGNDDLLGSLLQDTGPQSPIKDAVSQVPLATVGNVLNQAPQLGVLGEGGLTEDLLGTHPTGNVVGTDRGLGRALSGGNDGAAGSILNTESPPLNPVGESSTDALNSLAGNNEPLLGDVAGNVPGGIPSGDPVAAVSGLVGGLTGGAGGDLTGTVTGLVDGVTGGAPVGGLPVGDLGGTVTGAVPGNLPETVGGLLGGLTGGESPVGGDLLGGVLGGLGGSAANSETSAAASPRGLLRGRR